MILTQSVRAVVLHPHVRMVYPNKVFCTQYRGLPCQVVNLGTKKIIFSNSLISFPPIKPRQFSLVELRCAASSAAVSPILLLSPEPQQSFRARVGACCALQPLTTSCRREIESRMPVGRKGGGSEPTASLPQRAKNWSCRVTSTRDGYFAASPHWLLADSWRCTICGPIV